MGDCNKTKGAARIPRETVHDQQERLTTKHIHTLEFLQEIANENKALKAQVEDLEKDLSECQDLHNFAKESKAKIKEIQDGYLARADEINFMLTDKHRTEMMQIQEEKLEIEREMKEQMLRMRHEIETLKAANKDLRDTAIEEDDNNEMKKKLKQMNGNLQDALTENEELKEEIDCLKGDLEVLQGKKSTDMIQLAELRAENKRLDEELLEVQQNKNELEYRLEKALTELKEKNDDQEKSNLIENLRDKLKQLSLERDSSAELSAQLERENSDLHSKLGSFKSMNIQLQEELEKLLSEYGHLAVEHERLRKRCLKEKDKKTFKDFVSLKRELNCIKDENDTLKTRMKSSSIVMLKEDPVPPAILPPMPPLKKNPQKNKKALAVSLINNS